MIRTSLITAGLSVLLVASQLNAVAATVTVPEKGAPESITVAPNGDLILGSSGGGENLSRQERRR